jgi:2-polyprenyl-3-methyl-5-hydroxy-6-metoxy-1,4-benzoquinol methylase
MSDPTDRPGAYGETHSLTVADQFGVWLSSRRVRKSGGSFRGKRVGDFGCGYDARFVRSVLEDVQSAVLVDVSIAEELKAHPKVCATEGQLPGSVGSVGSGSLDVVLCVSVLEHLTEPEKMLDELRRVTAPGGVCLINVPNWLGKRFLELSAYRLGLSPAESIDDHKTYYDPRDLWPLLVRAGFRPRLIRCYRHKFFLNTFARCTVDG